MQPRMTHPAMIVPDAMSALQAVGQAVGETGLPAATIELVALRASQINGCAVCLEGHVRALRKMGESDERLATVAGWREAPWFSDAERAALALTEAATRLADRPDAVSDELWTEVARHYDEVELGALVLAIANINVWNRLNVVTGQVAGSMAW
jgi:AhpD family alkylhydroperoxidase